MLLAIYLDLHIDGALALDHDRVAVRQVDLTFWRDREFAKPLSS